MNWFWSCQVQYHRSWRVLLLKRHLETTSLHCPAAQTSRPLLVHQQNLLVVVALEINVSFPVHLRRFQRKGMESDLSVEKNLASEVTAFSTHWRDTEIISNQPTQRLNFYAVGALTQQLIINAWTTTNWFTSTMTWHTIQNLHQNLRSVKFVMLSSQVERPPATITVNFKNIIKCFTDSVSNIKKLSPTSCQLHYCHSQTFQLSLSAPIENFWFK